MGGDDVGMAARPGPPVLADLDDVTARLRAMVEGAEEGMALTDAEGRCIEVNSFFARLVGRSRDDLVGRTVADFHRGSVAALLEAILASFREDPTARPQTLQRVLGGVEVMVRLQPLRCGESFAGVLLNAIPVTELVEARRTAEQASEAKSRFLANVSHEIRTPLNTILGFADLLNGEPLTQDQHEMILAIKGAGRALLDIINDILDLSRIEAGKLYIERLRFRPAELVDEVMRDFRLQAESRGLGLISSVDGDVPDVLVGDRTRIRQILWNLVSNALKFTSEGKVAILVSGEPRAEGFRLRIRVRDTGIGIPADRLEAIFEPFAQADGSIARRYGGTGLGLAITRRLASLMDGTVEVTSTPGRGSTFTVHLTVEVPATPARRRSDTGPWAPTRTPSAVEGADGALRVLVADDNEVNRELASRTLERLGYEVVLASTGQEALEILGHDPDFDAVLMDVQMPGLDGLETTRRIRQQPWGGRIPIIALSASVWPEDQDRARKAGCSDYLTKPTDWRHANSRIRTLLAGSPPSWETTGGGGSGPGAPPIFDQAQALAKLCGDEDLLNQVMQVFRANAERHLAALATARTADDRGQMAALLHKLKGAAASVGAARIAAAAAAAEEAARNPDAPVGPLIDAVAAEFHDLQAELDR